MKQLLIIVYKINIDGLSVAEYTNTMQTLMRQYSLYDDVELKNDYTIREIWLPVRESESDVKIIYPNDNIILENDNELSNLIFDMNEQFKNNPNILFNKDWIKFIRELKLKAIEIKKEIKK